MNNIFFQFIITFILFLTNNLFPFTRFLIYANFIRCQFEKLNIFLILTNIIRIELKKK